MLMWIRPMSSALHSLLYYLHLNIYPLSKHDCTPHIIWMVEVSLAALSALSKLIVRMCVMQDSNLAS